MKRRKPESLFFPPARAAGETKYTWLKMFRLALDAVVGFSEAPLRLSLWIGGLVLVLGTLIAAWPHSTRRSPAPISSVAYATGDD